MRQGLFRSGLVRLRWFLRQSSAMANRYKEEVPLGVLSDAPAQTGKRLLEHVYLFRWNVCCLQGGLVGAKP